MVPFEVVKGGWDSQERNEMNPGESVPSAAKGIDGEHGHIKGRCWRPQELVIQHLQQLRRALILRLNLEVLELSFLLQDEFQVEHYCCVLDQSFIHLRGIDELVDVLLLLFLCLSLELV